MARSWIKPPRDLKGAPRGEPKTGEFEMRVRIQFALSLFEQGIQRQQVVQALMLPPAKPGAKDPNGRPLLGGFNLSRRAAVRAANKAMRKAEVEWTHTRAFDRVTQKFTLETAIAGALREGKWNAVAALSNVLARVTGTMAPIEVKVNVADTRRRAFIELIDQMPDAEFAELTSDDDVDRGARLLDA